MRVLAAVSGGVDSAVAAARAVDAGHDVTAVHLALARDPASVRTGARGCCTLEDARDARRAADVLGIPFYVWDLAERFAADVVDDFVSEYAAGRTPNPCLRCNEKIKFAAVLDKASYVLAVLTRDQLARAVFPLGDSTKAEVRAEAAQRGLAVADKPDSHDVCFVADGDTRRFLRDRLGDRPGPLVDALTGQEVGRHDGAYGFTVGQRRGLRLQRPAGDGQPRYVLGIEPVGGRVTVGPGELLDVTAVTGDRPVWTAGTAPAETFDCAAQLRAHGAVTSASVRVAAGRIEARLHEPQRGVATGQAVVLYDGDTVLGSATITATRAPAAARG